jgi:hypothetical protein
MAIGPTKNSPTTIFNIMYAVLPHPKTTALSTHAVAHLHIPLLIYIYRCSSTMDPTELPHRVSQTPKEITNPKTPKKTKPDEEWQEKIKIARKVSAEATAMYEEENAKKPSTPIQNIRVFSAKIEELDAHTRLADYEAEYLSSQIDALKRDRPEDEDDNMRAELLTQMRKKRKTSAEYIKKSLALQSERATFLESTTDAGEDSFSTNKAGTQRK